MGEMKETNFQWLGSIPSSWELKKIKYVLKERIEKNNSIIVIRHRHSLISIPFIPAIFTRFLPMSKMRIIPSKMSLMRWLV